MLLLESLILDISVRTAKVTSWTLKTGSCYIHEGREVNEKFIIRLNDISQRRIKKVVERCS